MSEKGNLFAYNIILNLLVTIKVSNDGLSFIVYNNPFVSVRMTKGSMEKERFPKKALKGNKIVLNQKFNYTYVLGKRHGRW